MNGVRVNCVFFGEGCCSHAAAPRPFFARFPPCVLCTTDPRIRQCSLRLSNDAAHPPSPPPSKP